MHISRGLKQAYDVQNIAHSMLVALGEQLKNEQGEVIAPDKDIASSISSIARVWSDAQERIRIHRGKPLPGSLKPEAKQKQQRSAPTLQIASDAQATPAAEQPSSEAAA